MLEKMKIKGILKEYGVEDFLNVADIDAGAVLDDERKILFFVKEAIEDTGSMSKEEFLERAREIERDIAKLADGFECSITIKIDSKNGVLDRYFSKGEGFKKEFLQSKKRLLSGKKSVFVYATIESSFYNEAAKILFERLGFRKMSDLEIFAYLYDVYNPDKRRNDLRAKLPNSLQKKLSNPSISIMRILYDSYIEISSQMAIGDRYVKVWRFTSPPPQDPSIVSLIWDVASMDCEGAAIGVKIRCDDDISDTLLAKSKMAKGSLLSTNFLNRLIDQEVTAFLEALNKEHMRPVEVEVSIALWDTKPIGDLVLNRWGKSSFIYERIDLFEAYLKTFIGAAFWGVYNGFYASSLHGAMLWIPFFYGKWDVPSIFSDRFGYIHPYAVYDEQKNVNSSLISAPTGSGKSVFLNYVIFTYFFLFEEKLNSLILDYGGSYKNLVAYLNRNFSMPIVYKELTPNEGINIFDLEYGKPITKDAIANKVTLLLYFFEIAFRRKLTDEEKTLIALGIEKTYESFLFGEDRKFDASRGIENKEYYTDRYEKNGDLRSFLLAMPTISDLVFVISSYEEIRNSFSSETVKEVVSMFSNFAKSPFGKLFTTPSTQAVTAKNVVIDIKPLIAADKSGHLASLYFTYYASSKYASFIDKGIKDERKIFIIDEYPRFLKSAQGVEEFVDMLLKTGRKEKIDTFLIAQNVDTFSEDFFENIGNLYLFRPQTLSEMDKIKSALGVEDSFISTIMEIESKKGVYSEIMAISLGGKRAMKTVLRYELSDFERQHFLI